MKMDELRHVSVQKSKQNNALLVLRMHKSFDSENCFVWTKYNIEAIDNT